VIEPASAWILREIGRAGDTPGPNEAFDRSLAGKEVSIDDLKAFLVRAGFGQPGDDFEALPSWPGWVRNRQVLSGYGTIWDYADSFERLCRLDAPVLAVKGTDTTPDEAAIVDALVAAAPRGRVLELPGDHASHLQNMDRFLAELRGHAAAVPTIPASY
jgi:pimeloyl-ACP methyl ester carboxylesterase